MRNSCFRDRSLAFMRAAAQVAARLYSVDGDWTSKGQPTIARERYWLALSVYEAGMTDLADAMIRRADPARTHPDAYHAEGSRFDIFHSNIAAMCLKLHGSKMAQDVREDLTALVAEAIGPEGRDRGAKFQFHGYNDNMPAKAALGLIVGGELLGDESAVAHGVASLRALRAMLVRRGTISEYNSPTYSAVTLHALAEIAEHARSEEARDIALKAEERLWIDLAARFHPEIGCASGPYSRGYTVDLLASVTCISSLLWFVLGDVVKPSPMILFGDERDVILHHACDYSFNISQMSWFATGSYHVPEIARRLFAKKTFPFHAAATCETGDGGPDFPARSAIITTYLREDYSLGSATSQWIDGVQGAPYFVTYKRNREVRSHRDIGTIFSKFVVNDEEPGFVPENACAPIGEEDCLKSHGGALTLQSESTALVLTHPHMTLGGNQDKCESRPRLSRLSEMVLFPSHFGSFEELIVGREHRSEWSGSVRSGEWIACRRGRLLVAIHPIAYSRDFGPASLSLERINRYEVIRATFYCGEERELTRDNIRFIFGGFVAEHAGVDEYPSLEAFVDDLRAGVVTDFLCATRRTRYIRPRTSRRTALDMETSWSPGAPLPRFASIDGRVADCARVQIDGLDDGEIPFFSDSIDSAATSPLPFAAFPMSWKEE